MGSGASASSHESDNADVAMAAALAALSEAHKASALAAMSTLLCHTGVPRVTLGVKNNGNINNNNSDNSGNNNNNGATNAATMRLQAWEELRKFALEESMRLPLCDASLGMLARMPETLRGN